MATGTGSQKALCCRPFVAALLLSLVGLQGCTSHGSTPRSGPTASTPASGQPSPTITRVPLTEDAARRLETDARSGREAAVRRAFAVPSGVTLDRKFVAAIKALGDITVHEETFAQTGDTEATVEISTTSQGRATRWVADLVLDNGQWLIAGTRRTA